MEFSAFAGRLHGIIGAGSSTSAFTKAIIESILTDNAPEITAEYSEGTYKAYFNGNSKITRLAKKIAAYIEPFNFSEYINAFPDGVLDLLVKGFEDVIPDADAHHIGGQLAELFESIIVEAVQTVSKKKSPAKDEAEKRNADEQPSAAADTAEEAARAEEPARAEALPVADAKIQVINNPTIVNQYGEKNIHIEHLDVLNL